MLNENDLSRADLNLLVLFETVLGERHVGRAADRLSLSPSAVSHGLKRLRRLLNDPLFLRTPKGVVPTARALELAGPVAEALAQIRRIVASADPFDPVTSTRRFVLGATDGISAVFLPPLLERLREAAPQIGISIRQLLPLQGGTTQAAWEHVFAELEAREADIAAVPLDDIPARFESALLYSEDFVVVMRPGHPFLGAPNLDSYCRTRHLVVSLTGDSFGFRRPGARRPWPRPHRSSDGSQFHDGAGHDRRDGADHRRAAAVRGNACRALRPRHRQPPLTLPRFSIRLVASKAAMMDAGVNWMFETLVGASRT
jgi:DNA-binding transcriptional LysR family regulator